MNKCYGELTMLIVYLAVLVICIMAVIYQVDKGKPQSMALEWIIVLIFDQIKSVPLQYIIYWVVIRRLGQLPISEGFDGVWDDKQIFEGGVEMSLMNLLRSKVQKFVEIKWVDNTILAVTIVLCVVIFAELALDD